MSNGLSRSLLVLTAWSVAFATLHDPCAIAQTGTPSHSSTPRLPSQHEVVAPFWSTEPGWNTLLEISNNLTRQDLVVNPVLRTAMGSAIALPPLTVPHDQSRQVDLRTLVRDLSGRVGSYGSVVFRYSSVSRGNLFATVLLQRMGQPIAFHFDAFPVDPNFVAGSQESVWWLPHPTADGFLVVSNFSPRPLRARQILTGDGKSDVAVLTLGPYQTRRVSVRDVVQHAGFKATFGGLRVEFDGDAGASNVSEFLFDEDAEFSALMKVFDRDPTAPTGAITLRAPLVGLAQPDPVLGYPDGVVLNPRLFLRNAAERPIAAEIALDWKGQSSSGRIPIKLPALAPEETRVLDLSTLQKQGLPPEANWASVAITYSGRPGDLVPLAASYDDSTRYGLQSPFSDSLSFMWKGGMWHYDVQHDSLITTGNAGTKDARVAVSFFFGENGTYEMPERILKPGQQIWLDVGELIRNQVPDKHGRAIPADTMSGSYEIKDLNDTNVGYLYEGKLMTDKTFGHATYGCAPCCGYDDSYLLPNPLSVPVAGGGTLGVWAVNDCTGEPVAKGGAYNWSSSTPPVASVNQSGYMTGVSPGSTSVSSYISLRIPGVKNCPAQVFRPAGPGNVIPAISGPTTLWWFKGISLGISGYLNEITLTASPLNGTYQWAVVAGSDKVSLSSSNYSSVVVTSIGQSTKLNDVSITATVDGETSAPFALTVRAPYALGSYALHPTPVYTADPVYVWDTYVYYQVRDNFLTPMPVALSVNEYFTTAVVPDYSGTNWRQGSMGCAPTSSDAGFADMIGGEIPSQVPTPVYNPSWTGVKVQHWGQDWHVGSCVNGSGPRVQSDTLQKWTDHALHTNIVTPSP